MAYKYGANNEDFTDFSRDFSIYYLTQFIHKAQLCKVWHNRAMQHIREIIQEKNILLTGADALSQKGFTQVPNHVLESEKISPGAKLTYAMLLKYAWQNDFCFPGQERLAKDMGVSLRSTNAYVQELEKSTFIHIKRRGQGKPNLYELLLTTHTKGVAKRK